MRHTNFVDLSSSITIVNDNDSNDKSLYKIENDNAVSLEFPSVETINGHYKIIITAPDTACYLFVKWGDVEEIIRVGNPDVRLFALLDSPKDYTQYDITDGSILDNGQFTNIVDNLYYIVPVALQASYYHITDYGIISLKVPYTVVNFTSDDNNNNSNSRSGAYQNFIDIGYAEFGFLGIRHSYFDETQGVWIEDSTKEATAYDLAKAVAHKYNLSFNRTDNNYIGNYVAYMRTYDEEAKKFRLYVPGVTPIDNENNFTLYTTDELGNDYLHGVSMLVIKSLETTNDGSSGLIIPYR